MEPWSITLSATLNRPVPREQAFALGRRIAADSLLSVGVHETGDVAAFNILMTSATPDPIDALVEARRAFVEQLAASGYTVTGWDAAEVLSEAESERRLANLSIPPMVSAAEFAELCEVTDKWIYKLEKERQRAAGEGRPHPFPRPVVTGYWLRSAAEHFAENRKRKPGPAPHPRS
ncbi:hypothetical protein [Amycolatopsis thermophila]|uniref:DNA-binding transcriptional regulator AlpA n=1 Tax=Amycolatopsis thermophila TaxID=206084 RepID=A0ABU0EN27_9PSEU|nr:hypothetical protein [Amycolatopsis thermophila]MDQ0376637.1 putative DNA-binding transcriptional regulator AlpA [Amycolatopsis thermophila]